MADLKWFDAQNTPPSQAYEHLPAGEYQCVLEASEMADTKDGHGKRLKLTFQVVAGAHKGRKIFEGLNIVNRSEKAQEIARGQLSSLCRAVGVLTPTDSRDLHNKPLIVVAGVKLDQNGEPQNTCKAFKAVDKPAAVKVPVSASPAPVQGGDDIPF